MRPRRSFPFVVSGAVAVLTSLGCNAPEPEDPTKLAFAVDVNVTSDPGVATSGADLLVAGQKVATTDADGRAHLSLRGAEGDTVEIIVKCPNGFQSPSEGVSLSLRRLSAGSRAPSFPPRCAPSFRVVVIGIRAENGPSLPVMHLGKEVGRTDAWGAAHVVLSVKANEQVALVLDTKSGGDKAPKLHPDSPTLTFVAKDKDDFVTLDQKFDIERSVVRPRPHVTRGGPTRI
jgi:hypothetical protein